MARVLIADDHAMIRAGLRRWLEQDRSVEAVAEAGSGAETLQQLRDGSWDLVVLDINMPDRSGIDILRHIRAGHTVLAGRRFASAALTEMLVNALDEPADRPLHASLSQREFQILCKLAVGRSVSEIAQELCISVKTVSTYRARVLEKMHLETNADLTTYALRNGLVQ